MTTFPVQSEANLLAEIRALRDGPVAKATQEVAAQIQFREMGHPQPGVFHDAPWWILRAQAGVLAKLDGFPGEDRPLGSMELLALARHLFEALIWLKLFNVDEAFGLVFYARFLAQQKETQVQLIEKIEQEIVLFEEFDALDGQALSDAFDPLLTLEPTEDQIAAAQGTHRARMAALDDEVRRRFTLYGAQAKFNSYAYQAHLLRTKAIPEQAEALRQIGEHITRFEAERDHLLTGRYRTMAEWGARWNWKDRATEVGLVNQYVFLYGYTSRLLHATPMNLITETTLSDAERMLLLEYIYVATRDALHEVDRFSFAGKVRVLILPDEG